MCCFLYLLHGPNEADLPRENFHKQLLYVFNVFHHDAAMLRKCQKLKALLHHEKASLANHSTQTAQLH